MAVCYNPIGACSTIPQFLLWTDYLIYTSLRRRANPRWTTLWLAPLVLALVAVWWVRFEFDTLLVEAHAGVTHLIASQALLTDIDSLSPKTFERLQQAREELAAGAADLTPLDVPAQLLLAVQPLWGWWPNAAERASQLRGARAALALSRAGVRACDLALQAEPLLSSRDHASNALLTFALSSTAALELIAHDLDTASRELGQMDPASLDPEQQTQVRHAQALIPQASAALDRLLVLTEPARRALGYDQARTYLVLLQNNLELRPTGGFIGMYAQFTLAKGEITASEIRNAYEFPAAHLAALGYPPAPRPLHLYLGPDGLTFHDANWWPDFPTSARFISSLYNLEYDRPVDGIIAINFSTLGALLGLTGPIMADDVEAPITQNNFYEWYFDVRSGDDRYKKILASLGHHLIARVQQMAPNELARFAPVIEQAFTHKDIQLYFTDPALQSFVHAQSWDGAIRAEAGDYLMVVDTNLIDKTSDRQTDEIRYDAVLDASGRVKARVTISYTSTYIGLSQRLYTRAYLPPGSSVNHLSLRVPRADAMLAESDVIFADNRVVSTRVSDPENYLLFTLAHSPYEVADVATEADKAVVASPLAVPEGDGLAVLQIEYETPPIVVAHGAEKEYHFVLQRQAGAPKTQVHYSLVLPSGAQVIRMEGNDLTATTANRIEAAFLLEQDRSFTIVYRSR